VTAGATVVVANRMRRSLAAAIGAGCEEDGSCRR